MNQNFRNLDSFADMLEPAVEIINSKAVKDAVKQHKSYVALISIAIKENKAAVVKLLAALDGVPAEEYKVPGTLGMIKKLLALGNDPELKDLAQDLFTLQAQMKGGASSGSATESTEDGA